MADAKISALPISCVLSSDIIPFTVVSTSITSGIQYKNFFASASMTGVANFADTGIVGASIASATVIRPIISSPSVTGTFESTGFVNIVGSASIGGAVTAGGGNMLVSGAASALGYAAGAGGTVTQSVGGTKEQAVALNRAVGKIVMSNSVMAASTLTSMLFGNSVMGVNDVLAINYIGNGLAGTNMRSYTPTSSMVAPGSAIINIKSNNNFADTSSIFLAFAVIKGAIT